MFVDASDIRSEFKALSEMDFRNNYSLAHLCQNFKSDGKIEKSYNIIRAVTPKVFGMNNPEQVTQFSLYLKEYGNIEYCRKLVGIGRAKATKIVHILNEMAKGKNLPILYKFRTDNINTAKLSDRQVSIIKYLLHKGYSTHKLADIYSVNQSSINLINLGITWKEINPILQLKGERVIPKFSKYHKKNKSIDVFFTDDLLSKEVFEYIVWGEQPKCPHCGSIEFYKFPSGVYKCKSSDCYQKYTAKTGGYFSGSKLTYTKWLNAMYIYNKDRNVTLSQLSLAVGLNMTSSMNTKKKLMSLFLTPIWQRFEMYLQQRIKEAC